MPLSETLQADPWLSSIFGFDVIRVGDVPSEWPSPRTLFFAKVPVRDVASISRFTQAGFRVVDTMLTFERRSGAVPFPNPDSLPVRPAKPEDQERLLEIAGTAFEFS